MLQLKIQEAIYNASTVSAIMKRNNSGHTKSRCIWRHQEKNNIDVADIVAQPSTQHFKQFSGAYE